MPDNSHPRNSPLMFFSICFTSENTRTSDLRENMKNEKHFHILHLFLYRNFSFRHHSWYSQTEYSSFQQIHTQQTYPLKLLHSNDPTLNQLLIGIIPYDFVNNYRASEWTIVSWIREYMRPQRWNENNLMMMTRPHRMEKHRKRTQREHWIWKFEKESVDKPVWAITLMFF